MTFADLFVRLKTIIIIKNYGHDKHAVALLFIFLLSSSFNSVSAYAQNITLNSGTAEPFITADGKGFYAALTKELFSRINMDAKVIRLPSSRSIINANEGIDDGVIARTIGMEKKYSNLIRIPVDVLKFKFMAYTLDKSIEINKWDSLKPYSVAYIRGWRIYEKNVVDAKTTTLVQGPEQLFRLLSNKRTDLILFEYYRGSWWNTHMKTGARLIGTPLAEKDMFIYMHKKHADIVPRLTDALIKLKADGTYQKIKDETLSVYLN